MKRPVWEKENNRVELQKALVFSRPLSLLDNHCTVGWWYCQYLALADDAAVVGTQLRNGCIQMCNLKAKWKSDTGTSCRLCLNRNVARVCIGEKRKIRPNTYSQSEWPLRHPWCAVFFSSRSRPVCLPTIRDVIWEMLIAKKSSILCVCFFFLSFCRSKILHQIMTPETATQKTYNKNVCCID